MKPTTFQSLLSATILMVALDIGAAPRLELFPTSVAENIRHASESASKMETEMEVVMRKMDEQQKLYQSAQCDNSSKDQGCGQIKRQIGETYREFLGTLKDTLPDVKTALQSTANELGSKIRQQLGNSMTPRDVQNLISGKKHSAGSIRKATGRKQGRISRMLDKINQMISLHRNNAPIPAMLAAEIYADSSEALDIMTAIESTISASEVPLMLEGLWNGGPNEEMMGIVEATKVLLFGEADEVALPQLVNAPAKVEDDFSDWIIE